MISTMELTKEEIQRRIDRYMESAKEQKDSQLAFYYSGKADAYIDLYNELYPEMEGKRAYPLNKKV
ncbi:MAG: hypothetical protein KBT27_11350 [Prevotellaceae bacterium]|nr:hypothetical protein [Candidatus Faecinaster equi]